MTGPDSAPLDDSEYGQAYGIEGSAVIRLGVDSRELGKGVYTGIGRYVLEVLRAASEDGWECVAYGDCTTQPDLALPDVNLRVLDSWWPQWWDQVSLPRQLRRDRVSVFLSPYYKGPLWPPCPMVLTIHDLFFIGYPGQRRPLYDATMNRLARLYAGRADAIIADSKYSKRSIVNQLGVNPEKVHVIPIALGTEFKPTRLIDSVRSRYRIMLPYVLYVGNFKPHKNLFRLLRAYAGLDKSLRIAHQLVLAGGDHRSEPALRDLAHTLGVEDQVVFPGQIEGQDLPAIYSGSTLFILPSLVEGFGLPALEAMACGVPVVAANRAAIPEVVGEAAVLVDPEDVPAMTRAMARVLSESSLRETLRQQGLARAREFSRDRTSGRVLSLLRSVCDNIISRRRQAWRSEQAAL